MSGVAFKDEGNAHFKAGEFLKAAASYTKAIKAEPTNHVYYSNRANAFLKLSKVGKALEDADKCIALDPQFVKGYHRKASALHATGEAAKSDEAAEVLLAALEMGIDNNDLVRLGITIKGKAFVKMADARRKGEPEPAEPPPPAEKKAAARADDKAATENAPPPSQLPKKPKAEGAAAQPEGPPKHLYELDPESFAGLMIRDVFSEVLDKKVVPTIAYMQPAAPRPGTREEPGLQAVGIEHAFASPSTLSNCAEFLKKHIGETRAQSSMIVVRKGAIGFPRVWQGKPKGTWPHSEKQDGIFMQLEARGARAVFFTAIDKQSAAKGGGYAVGDTAQLDAEEFGLFPRLFT